MLKVMVKGDKDGDWELLAFGYRKNRLFDHELVELLDKNGQLIYTVPFENMRIMEFIEGTEEDQNAIPEFNREQHNLAIIYQGGNNTHYQKEGNRIHSERYINKTKVDLHAFVEYNPETKEDKWICLCTIPYDNIVYINHANPIQVDTITEKVTQVGNQEVQEKSTTGTIGKSRPKMK